MINIKKKVMFCFYKGDINNDLSIIESLNSNRFEFHLINDVNEENFEYDILLSTIKNLYGTKIDEYDIYISSNIKEFIMLEYILYSNWIVGALYINNNPVHLNLDKIYMEILNKEVCRHTNALNFYTLKNEENLFDQYCIFNGNFKYILDNSKIENTVYTYMEMNHVFSVKSNKNSEIVKLDNSINITNCKIHFDLEYLEEYIKLIDYYSNCTLEFDKNYGIVHSKLNEFKTKILDLPNFEKDLVLFKLDNTIHNVEYSDKFKIFLSSILLHIFKDRKYLEFLLELLTKSTSIDKYNRFYAYYQCLSYIFLNKYISDEKMYAMIESLYEKILNEFSVLNKGYIKVPKEQRNDNLVFVITSQLLTVYHSPSKIATDVCYNFMKNLNKKVILINTREVLTEKGLIPMMNINRPSEINEYNTINNFKYKDIKISFYQPKLLMPDDNEIINILKLLEKYKPSMIINIGTTLVGDLCAKIIPTATIPLGTHEYSKSTFYVVNDRNEYQKYTERYGKSSESIIISEYKFELKPKEHTFTKEQLGIPKNKFIISVIGSRLNEEIDESFLNVLEKICKLNNAYVLFIGKFKFSDEYVEKYKNLADNHKYMGFQPDLLAVLENVHIYLNPNRNGGGTSAIYALYLGKPVITLNSGDVAAITGEQFTVKSYDEMADMILKYQNDNEFYNKQSVISKKRGLELVDFEKYLKTFYDKVIASPLF